MNEIKINIIGASETGKSTLGKAISEKLKIPHFDSDDYYHFPTDPPFRKQRSPEERLSLLMKDLGKHSSWVLSGGAGVWEPSLPNDFSLVVFLYLPPSIRLERLKKRESELFGNRIEQGGDMEADHKKFMEWAFRYDDGTAEGTNTLPHHEAFLKTISCKVLRLESIMTTSEQLASILTVL